MKREEREGLAGDGRAGLDAIVRLALAEDLGRGDATVAAMGLARRPARGVIVAKQAGVLSGMRAAARVFGLVDPDVRFAGELADGARLARGSAVAQVHGPAGGILSAERTALNFLQHLSGIATLTAAFVERAGAGGVAILDTRKTTPGLRVLEKEAVRHGGGRNHRFGLFDAIMVKDNHIAAAGGVREAVARALAGNAGSGAALPVIVEVADLARLGEALQVGVCRILLDNLSPAQVREAAARIGEFNRGRAEGSRIGVEVSGGITLENVRAYALRGVDCISIGALTHSAPALDLSLDFHLDEPRGEAD